MISIQLAAGIGTALIVIIGFIHMRMEKRQREVKRLEKLLTDARRELSSLELLQSGFLGKIGDVLSAPLKAIEITSDKLRRDKRGLPEDVISDLSRLSEEVHSLVRILTVFEQISQSDVELESIPHGGPPEQPAAFSGAVRSKPSRSDKEIVQFDDLVSEAAMELADEAADRLVSLSVSICGSTQVSGSESQLNEAVTSLMQETMRRAAEGSLLSIDLSSGRNVELEINWTAGEKEDQKSDENLFGTGLTRLIASSHGGWVSEDIDEGIIRLILPKAGETE